MARLFPWATLFTLMGCAASPYDFPVPTMIGNDQGVSMTGFMATDSEQVVRERLAERMKCLGHIEFASLKTARADNAVGTKILHYDAIMRCVPAAAPELPAAAQ